MDDLFNIEAQKPRLALRTAPRPSPPPPTLPPSAALLTAQASLPDRSSPSYLAGQPASATAAHIVADIVPALTGQAASARYFGFVTGGVLPVAEWADNVVSRLDQNVQVHLPAQTAATAVEDAALAMLADLLGLHPGDWRGRTFTTGATASNILGLACGREAVVGKRLGPEAGESVGELGLLAACRAAGIADLQVLTSAGHSSLSKAAAAVGIGRRQVKELPLSAAEPWRLDLDAVERELARGEASGCASIVAVSAGEVNTGRFALDGVGEWTRLRALADRYGAWVHVDGAFGIFVRALERTDEFAVLHGRLEGIELADSITVDGHKILNVPYDCGMFFTRTASTLESVFTNPNAAYLSSGGGPSTIPSPLNVGIENSRRFRALPAYAVLLSEGRPGMARLVADMTRLARRTAAWLRASPHYELLPPAASADDGGDDDDTFIIVLFRAASPELNDVLVQRINDTHQMYVGGTRWAGKPAVRMAVSGWRVDVQRDLEVVKAILTAVAEGKEFDMSQCAVEP